MREGGGRDGVGGNGFWDLDRTCARGWDSVESNSPPILYTRCIAVLGDACATLAFYSVMRILMSIIYNKAIC